MTKEALPLPPNQPQSGIDILTLFREDLDPKARIGLFKNAAELLRKDVDELASPENVAYINDHYSTTLVLNHHGDHIDAAQSLAHIKNPFITFIEAAGAEDIHQDNYFAMSIRNAFDVRFDRGEPQSPFIELNQEPGRNNSWHYGQHRGLLAKASMIAPIDVRRYSSRLLSALIDADYSQSFLNESTRPDEFRYTSYTKLLEDSKNRGELIMYSNAVRELTSAKQIIETLMMFKEPQERLTDASVSDKVTALRDKGLRDSEKLNAYIMYGTGHHGFIKELRGRGIDVARVFADDSDAYAPSPFKFVGTAKDGFFNGRHYDTSEAAVTKKAIAMLLEDLLMIPVNHIAESGLVMSDKSDATVQKVRLSIRKFAQNAAMQDQLPGLIEEYKSNPKSIGKLLLSKGLPLRDLSDPS